MQMPSERLTRTRMPLSNNPKRTRKNRISQEVKGDSLNNECFSEITLRLANGIVTSAVPMRTGRTSTWAPLVEEQHQLHEQDMCR